MSKKQIQAIARRTINRCHINAIPVDVELICTKYGFVIFPQDLPDEVWGMTVKLANGKVVIVVSTNQSYVRRRFTIAHELGHIILNHRTNGLSLLELFNPSRTSSKIFQRFDREADIFAAELLMPVNAFRVEAVRCNYDVDILSDIFLVSKEAVRIKLSEIFGESHRFRVGPSW